MQIAPVTSSIITPSYRNSQWLKLCIASVADQQGVELEHIVQDSCSDDGTLDWLPHGHRVQAFLEKDAGMYDAVNRGYRHANDYSENFLENRFFDSPGSEVSGAGVFFSSAASGAFGSAFASSCG